MDGNRTALVTGGCAGNDAGSPAAPQKIKQGAWSPLRVLALAET